MFFIVLFVCITFIRRSVTSDGRDINHALPKLDESSPTISFFRVDEGPLDGDFQICDVMETEIDEFLVLFFA